MPSPFPGMDPYLESPIHWLNFHARFLTHLSDAINDILPPDYCSSIEERIRPIRADLLEEETTKFIQIVQLPDEELVTELELLSPSNKSEPGRSDYLRNRQELLKQRVHLIEMDFLTEGHRLPFREPLLPGDYYVFVARSDQRPDCEVNAWSVREPLPSLRIPLTAPDPDLVVNLQAVFQDVYNRGQFQRKIRYGQTVPAKLLSEQDRVWAAQQG